VELDCRVAVADRYGGCECSKIKLALSGKSPRSGCDHVRHSGFSGRFGRSSLAAGLRAIAHRGPDDSGVYVNEAAGVELGHARLSILDPPGHQPMAGADGAVVMVFNA